MPLSSQCVSLPLAKRLKELGVRQESLFYWSRRREEEAHELSFGFLGPFESKDKEPHISAFSSGELGEMLPFKDYNFRTTIDGLGRWDFQASLWATQAKTEADARALMLIHLLEQKIITI